VSFFLSFFKSFNTKLLSLNNFLFGLAREVFVFPFVSSTLSCLSKRDRRFSFNEMGSITVLGFGIARI